MPRPKSKKREEAYELWKGSDGKMLLKDIAAALNVSDNQVRKWKHQDRWEEIKDKVTLPNENSNVTKKKSGGQPGNRNSVGHGAPKGNKNAVGNKGGAPKGNNNGLKHGFFKLIFPDDEETQEILNEIQAKSPLQILWEQIQIQYLAIARAQKIMYVTDKDEMIKELKRSYNKNTVRSTEKTSSHSDECEYEYEFQFAWDRHATFLKAQSRAIQTLEQLITRYEKMLLKDLDIEEQQLKIEKLKAELEKIKNPNPEADLTSYLDALKTTAEETWADESINDKEDDPEGEADE